MRVILNIDPVSAFQLKVILVCYPYLPGTVAMLALGRHSDW